MLGREIRARRRTAGLSQRALGQLVGISQGEISRIEGATAPWLSVGTASAILSCLGLRLWAKVYPAGPPLRDAGHLRLLSDFEARLHPRIEARREWPIPDGSGRAVDLVLACTRKRVGVEAETLIADLQDLERELNLKQRDGNLDSMILLVRGSRRNREILRGADAFRRAFPLSTRAVLAALAAGGAPDGNGIVLL